MRPISPDVGWEEIHSEDPTGRFMAGAVAIHPFDEGNVSMLTRWRLTPADRARIVAGEDLYVVIIGDRLVPHGLSIGNPVVPELPVG